MEGKEEVESYKTGSISYKDVSQLSEVTDDVFADESAVGGDPELADYNRLKQQTQKKLKILSDVDGEEDKEQSQIEMSDEFLRNFFIKFGMKKTLESF